MGEPEAEPVRVTVDILPANLDKAFLSAASGNETVTEVINRALAFYYEIMAAKPGASVDNERC